MAGFRYCRAVGGQQLLLSRCFGNRGFRNDGCDAKLHTHAGASSQGRTCIIWCQLRALTRSCPRYGYATLLLNNAGNKETPLDSKGYGTYLPPRRLYMSDSPFMLPQPPRVTQEEALGKL